MNFLENLTLTFGKERERGEVWFLLKRSKVNDLNRFGTHSSKCAHSFSRNQYLQNKKDSILQCVLDIIAITQPIRMNIQGSKYS